MQTAGFRLELHMSYALHSKMVHVAVCTRTETQIDCIAVKITATMNIDLDLLAQDKHHCLAYAKRITHFFYLARTFCTTP